MYLELGVRSDLDNILIEFKGQDLRFKVKVVRLKTRFQRCGLVDLGTYSMS